MAPLPSHTMPAFAPSLPLPRRRAPPRVSRRPRAHALRRSRPPTAVHGPPPQQRPRAPPPPPSPGRTPDYHANVGSVIDQLRDFYPRLLCAEPDLAYYSRALVLCDSTGYRVAGHDAYRAAFWMLRAQARVFFNGAAVSITSLYYDDASGMIYLRWRLSASPRGWALLGGGRRGCVVLDGLSVYTLDQRGFVAVHQLENNARRRSGLRHMFEDILAVGTVRVPGTPAGAGVGTGAAGTGAAGSGVPPWFRSLHEPVEFMCMANGEELVVDDHDPCDQVVFMDELLTT